MISHEKARELHAESIIIDGLNISNWQDPEVFKFLHLGGLTAINATIAVWENFTETLNNIASWNHLFKKYKGLIKSVKNVSDIKKAKTEGRCGIIYGFQNSSPIEDDLSRLQIFYDLGVRIIQVTYNRSNFVGSGYMEPPEYGLTNFGLDFIEDCNELGVLLDCSHVGHKTTMDTIEASTKPVAFTHVIPRSLYDIPRNKTDEELKAVVEKDGVVGATGYAQFMAQKENSALPDFIDIIDYLVNLIGIDHVGVGMDFTQGQSQDWFRWLLFNRNLNRGPRIYTSTLQGQEWLKTRLSDRYEAIYPKGFETSADFPNLTQALLERGYSEKDTKKIIGENFLRLFNDVWK
jgi:membrane dipeptidase